MWFAGAVTLGARPGPTALRVALLAATGLAGLALIAVALIGQWSGVALDLAMEFGVGAVAVVVLDVVILGVLQARLDQYAARTPTAGLPGASAAS
jgi:tetrahydromethanopterin S-methyltransferase subunit E